MPHIQNQLICSNPLVEKLVAHSSANAISVGDLATRLGLTKTYIEALFSGKRDVKQLPIDTIRRLASLLGMPCTSALVLGGILKESDFA